MSVMNAEMYDALIAAGAPDDKARAAAVAMSEESLDARDNILSVKDDIANIKSDIAGAKGDLHILKWMTGLILVAIALPVIKIVVLPVPNSVF